MRYQNLYSIAVHFFDSEKHAAAQDMPISVDLKSM